MKNLLLLTIVAVFSSAVFSQSDDIRGRSEALDVNPRWEEAPKVKKLTKREKELLFPSKEIQAEFKPQLQGLGARLARIFPNETFAKAAGILGVRSFFSFQHRGPRDNNSASLILEKGEFRVMNAGADIGMIINLGDVELKDVSLDRPELKYLVEYSRPKVNSKARGQTSRLLARGITENGFFYSYKAIAQVNQTYAVRTIMYEEGDYLVVFRTLRQLDDGSYIFAWKILKKYSFPWLDDKK